jgi:hypothetical protein
MEINWDELAAAGVYGTFTHTCECGEIVQVVNGQDSHRAGTGEHT